MTYSSLSAVLGLQTLIVLDVILMDLFENRIRLISFPKAEVLARICSNAKSLLLQV